MKKFTESITESTFPIKITKFFSFSDLKAVIDGFYGAIQIKEFYPKEICNIVSKKIIDRAEGNFFNKASNIERLGFAHFEIDSSEKLEYYHKKAIENTWQLRDICEPYFSPVDKIRLLLEEIWPSGAQLEVLEGKKCFVGICRVMEPTVELLAHNDRLDRDSPNSMRARSLITQLSACVYLQVPEEGGELRLWMKEPKNEEEYSILKAGNYGIEMNTLGPPVHLIKPESGDLLIFNIRKYHGVAPGKGQPRINMGTFIGYRGLDEPLTYWS